MEREKWRLTSPRMSVQVSREEVFLLGFGCFNSFSAQYVLAKYSLRDILVMKCEELENALPLIPISVWAYMNEILQSEQN